jgi:hypothetical protein
MFDKKFHQLNEEGKLEYIQKKIAELEQMAEKNLHDDRLHKAIYDQIESLERVYVQINGY